MCKGLAVIATKINNKWIVYAKQHESSHDKLLHELDDGLRYGQTPHLKFEVIFPHQIKDDILQDINYPNDWTEIQFGKKIACIAAHHAVSSHLNSHPELLQFNTKMLSNADLRNADLRGVDLRGVDLQNANLQNANLQNANLQNANLQNADLQDAELQYADLQYANLRNADLWNADLQNANLWNADLQYANLQNADLRNADLRNAKYNSHTNIKNEYKTSMILMEI